MVFWFLDSDFFKILDIWCINKEIKIEEKKIFWFEVICKGREEEKKRIRKGWEEIERFKLY